MRGDLFYNGRILVNQIERQLIVKVALRGKKQLLEKIGVAARTTKTAAQQAAPQKAAATRAAKKA